MTDIMIENWKMGPDTRDPYKAPEVRPMVLYGHILNHPLQGDIPNGRTTPIVAIDLKNRKVTTKSRVYTLGKIDPAYKEWALKNSTHKTVELLKEYY
jgi:hypothetical protein